PSLRTAKISSVPSLLVPTKGEVTVPPSRHHQGDQESCPVLFWIIHQSRPSSSPVKTTTRPSEFRPAAGELTRLPAISLPPDQPASGEFCQTCHMPKCTVKMKTSSRPSAFARTKGSPLPCPPKDAHAVKLLLPTLACSMCQTAVSDEMANTSIRPSLFTAATGLDASVPPRLVHPDHCVDPGPDCTL